MSKTLVNEDCNIIILNQNINCTVENGKIIILKYDIQRSAFSLIVTQLVLFLLVWSFSKVSRLVVGLLRFYY